MANYPHRVLMITTGGTIAGRVAPRFGASAMVRTGDEFLELTAPAVEHLDSRHGLEVSIDTLALADVDSSDIQPEIWSDLASTIKERYDDFDSFIVTHGTNTLGYTSAALSFALSNPAKPIILTGSQVPTGLPGSDGLTNLQNALLLATWPHFGSQIRGIFVVFGSHIITGTRVTKSTDFDFDAFTPFGMASIGRIGRTIRINEPNLNRHLGYLSTGMWPEARDAASLRCELAFDTRIASLTEFPGMSSAIFETLVERCDIQGFILRAVGAGDPSTKHRQAFEHLKSLKIPLVIATQASSGISNFQVNESGTYLREHQLAIPAYDMSIEAQTTKLAWLLAKKREGNLTYEQLGESMVTDLHGEIDVVWEIGV
jgi:L-asparaginase